MKENEIKELTRQLDLFRNLVRVISSTLNINQLLNLITDMLISSVSAEVGIILLKDKEHFVPRATLGLSKNILREITAEGMPLLDWIVKQKTTLIIRDVMNDSRFVYPRNESLHIHSLIAMPLQIQKDMIGVTILANKSGDTGIQFFKDEDVQLVSGILSQVTVGIENALLYEEIINLKNYNESILNNIPSGVITTDLSGSIITMNQSAEYILGVSNDRFLGQNIRTLFSRVTDTDFDIMKYIQSGENIINYEITLQKENSEMIALGVSVSVLKNDKNRIIGSLINLIDFTEKKLIENQMHRTEQLAALGEMSAGLAHEIKNPLTSIRGFTQLLPNKQTDNEFLAKYIDIVTRESNRLNDIVERFLSFARPKVGGFQRCDINDILLNTLSLLHYQIEKNGITLQKKSLNIPAVKGDWQQLEQVFINIILNAVQMMDKEQKQMTIQTSSIVKKMMDNRYKEFVVVRITDNGPGIPTESLDRIFNPFYTTRKQGTGLGLSITNRIVEEHNGYIEVTSEPGKGSTFSIFLPAEENAARTDELIS
jgi:PAS domain S-box-containing protein